MLPVWWQGCWKVTIHERFVRNGNLGVELPVNPEGWIRWTRFCRSPKGRDHAHEYTGPQGFRLLGKESRPGTGVSGCAMGGLVGQLVQPLADGGRFGLFAFWFVESGCCGLVAIVAKIEFEQGLHGFTLRTYFPPNWCDGRKKIGANVMDGMKTGKDC